MKFFLILSLLLLVIVSSCKKKNSTTPPEPLPYPDEFASLYTELQSLLTQRENELRAQWDGTRSAVVFSATLLTASSNSGTKLLDPVSRQGNMLYLNRLAALGVQGVVLQINYPILTANFTSEAPALITAYKEIAEEIRALGLRIIVEHNVLLPGYASLDPTSYFASLTKTRFGLERYGEVLKIIQQVNPDYLSLVTEPGTANAVLPFQMSVTEWKSYIEAVLSQLSQDEPTYNSKIGAGSGAWEDENFVTTFAGISGMDFIDIHTYPLTNNVSNYLKNLETWAVAVRAINPDLEIVNSESWLYKAQASELGGAPTNAAFFARDVYSFWAQLDQQFLDVLTLTAHKNNFSVIAPFWSNYFFAYLDYGDPSLSGLSPTELLNRAFSEASGALQAGKTSSTGEHYKSLILNGP